MTRAIMSSSVLGAVVGSVLAAGVLFAQADGPASAVSIDNGIASANNAFTRSKAMDTGDSYSHTFNTPGTYQYFCYIHPHMTGAIVVEAAPG